MEFIQWNNNLSVGIPSIDEQHKKLIGLINELFNAMSEGKGRDMLEKTLIELKDYTVYHFGHEEKLMEKYGFPGLDDHKVAHQDFVKKIAETEEKYKQGAMLISIELFQFLKNWLTEHILKIDKEGYAPFLIERGVK